MRTRHLMALFTGVLILAIILPISLSIWQAARQACGLAAAGTPKSLNPGFSWSQGLSLC